MILIQVYVIRPESFQTVVACSARVLGSAALPRIVYAHPEFGGEHDAVAPSLERAAHELLALRASVDVRRVQKDDTCIERRIEHAHCGVVIQTSAKIVASQPDSRNVECSDLSRLHGVKS
jgi:hypothetical protein